VAAKILWPQRPGELDGRARLVAIDLGTMVQDLDGEWVYVYPDRLLPKPGTTVCCALEQPGARQEECYLFAGYCQRDRRFGESWFTEKNQPVLGVVYAWRRFAPGDRPDQLSHLQPPPLRPRSRPPTQS